MKRVLAVSILLNVILAGGILWSRNQQVPPVPTASNSLAESHGTPPAGKQNKAVTASPGTPAPSAKPFNWSQVESEDYRQYMANLRAIGCPEKTIRDIIIADVNDAFEARRAAYLGTNFPYWKRPPDHASEKRTQQGVELYLQKREALRALGIDEPDYKSLLWEVFREEVDKMHLDFEFLSGPEHERVKLMFFEQVEKEVVSKARNEHYSNDPDEDEDTKTRLRAILTPEELEEYELRTSKNANSVRKQLGEAELTESEFRTIFGWTRNLIELQIPRDSEAYKEAAMATNAAIKNLLGPERFEKTVLAKEISNHPLNPVK